MTGDTGRNSSAFARVRMVSSCSSVRFRLEPISTPTNPSVKLVVTCSLSAFRQAGERLGKHIWNEEVLRETRGHWMYPRVRRSCRPSLSFPLLTKDSIPRYFRHQHDDLRRFLYRAATALGAKIRFNTLVASIDPDRCTATLATAEVLHSHVIIGADGPNGVMRGHFPGPDMFDPGTMKMYQ